MDQLRLRPLLQLQQLQRNKQLALKQLRLKNVKPEDLTENSVLLGSSARIVEILKKVDAAGFDEVILYVNVGLKPHQQVKDEMARFMAEVAPAFASARREVAA